METLMCERYRLAASLTPPTEDLACSPGTCPDWESNLRHFGSQAGDSIHSATAARAVSDILKACFLWESGGGPH